MATPKESIIAEIQRTAAENDGVPLGQGVFERETGIAVSSWRGKYWRTWGEAVTAAGLVPNVRNEAHDRKFLIESLARLTRKNERFPTYADMRLERQVNRSFPGHQPLTRLGTVAERVEIVRQYASDNSEYGDILSLLPEVGANDDAPISESDSMLDGFVYMGLLKIGREKRYKIGKTNLVERRTDQISVQLPADLELVHAIRTDDATGIEAYWHRRFAAKRTKGEWFNLSREDVTAFKRRKFM
ncbi:MAG: GIY-YIG nuclease family protein [Proteobacteria bacterium]|nr:GIY-YIG nuclease family protein [Pseudomonadota bacterium]